jgi:large subunit ribosomal protein L18
MIKTKGTRVRAKIRIRKKISGTAEKPRLTVYRSLDNVYAQLIDDATGTTLLSVSSLAKELAEAIKGTKGKITKSKLVGKLLAEKALAKNITTAVFDRNGYKFHGRIKAIAEGVREGGLKV